MREVIRQAKETENEVKALKECTFTPVKSVDKKQKSRDHSRSQMDKSIYERNKEWEHERQSKIDMCRLEKEAEPDPCTFRPVTSTLNHQIMNSYPKELRDSTYMQEALASYYHRMDKARSRSPNKSLPRRKSVGNVKIGPTGVSGPPCNLVERCDTRKSVEASRERLREAVKNKYQKKRLALHDQLMSMSTFK
jgi:hypothetical protein